MAEQNAAEAKSQLDKLKEAAREFEYDDETRLKERLGKPVKPKQQQGKGGART